MSGEIYLQITLLGESNIHCVHPDTRLNRHVSGYELTVVNNRNVLIELLLNHFTACHSVAILNSCNDSYLQIPIKRKSFIPIAVLLVYGQHTCLFETSLGWKTFGYFFKEWLSNSFIICFDIWRSEIGECTGWIFWSQDWHFI